MKQQRVFKLALLGLSDHERRVIQSVINNLGTRERAYRVLEKTMRRQRISCCSIKTIPLLSTSGTRKD